MRVFLDTEFTSLESPQLLSIGMVSEVGLECYIELDLESATGQKRIAVATQFVLTNVLSQWGRERIESNVTEHLGLAAANWLERMAEYVNDSIELVYADKVDADLLEEALKSAGPRWVRIKSRLQWSIVSYLHGEQVVDDAMSESLASCLEQQGIGRHHALADVRALRAGFQAMHGTQESPRAVETHAAEAASCDRSAQWLAENAEAINSMNAYVEEHGLPLGGPSDDWMQAVNDLASAVMELISETGGLNGHSTSGLLGLRSLAEHVRST